METSVFGNFLQASWKNKEAVFINFLVGGGVVASVSAMATWMSPVAGAIWWSFPFTLIPSIYFMHSFGKSNQAIGEFLYNASAQRTVENSHPESAGSLAAVRPCFLLRIPYEL